MSQFGEALVLDQNKGVPLEHLIACVRSVSLRSLSPPKSRKVIIGSSSNCTSDGKLTIIMILILEKEI